MVVPQARQLLSEIRSGRRLRTGRAHSEFPRCAFSGRLQDMDRPGRRPPTSSADRHSDVAFRHQALWMDASRVPHTKVMPCSAHSSPMVRVLESSGINVSESRMQKAMPGVLSASMQLGSSARSARAQRPLEGAHPSREPRHVPTQREDVTVGGCLSKRRAAGMKHERMLTRPACGMDRPRDLVSGAGCRQRSSGDIATIRQ